MNYEANEELIRIKRMVEPRIDSYYAAGYYENHVRDTSMCSIRIF